jgi:hypothetical protein
LSLTFLLTCAAGIASVAIVLKVGITCWLSDKRVSTVAVLKYVLIVSSVVNSTDEIARAGVSGDSNEAIEGAVLVLVLELSLSLVLEFDFEYEIKCELKFVFELVVILLSNKLELLEIERFRENLGLSEFLFLFFLSFLSRLVLSLKSELYREDS